MTTVSSTASTTTDTTKSALAQTNVDFDMFLKLLTTQMTNQDPLKPMDSTEYTQQLAQYSQVEQTVKQTSTLNDILAQLTTQNVAQASSFIGKEATFDYATSGLSESTPASWSYSAATPMADLKATVTDDKGRKVFSQTLAPDQVGEFSWDGKKSDGTTAVPGAYTLTLDGKTANGDAVVVGITTSGRVDQVMGANGSVTLKVNGIQVPMAKLTGVGTADSTSTSTGS